MSSDNWKYVPDDDKKTLDNFASSFKKFIEQELNDWLEKEIKQKILKENFSLLDREGTEILQGLQDLFEETDERANNFKKQIELSLDRNTSNMQINTDNLSTGEEDGVGFGIGLGGAGLVAGALFMFTGIGLIPIALAALGSGFGLGAIFGESQEEKKERLKHIVIDKGLEKFDKSVQEIYDQISEKIISSFERQMLGYSNLMRKAIFILENSMEKQEEMVDVYQKVSEINTKIDILN